jgi:hypothetical protein
MAYSPRLQCTCVCGAKRIKHYSLELKNNFVRAAQILDAQLRDLIFIHGRSHFSFKRKMTTTELQLTVQQVRACLEILILTHFFFF